MSEAELNSYRFGSGEDPSDEMLAQIMREAADDASKRGEETLRKYFDDLKQEATAVEKRWASRINSLRNG